MKHKGGVPPAFRKNKPDRDMMEYNVNRNTVNAMIQSMPQKSQTLKSGLTQLLSKSKSPFTGPGPSTAGRRRRRTRKVSRRI